jgi:hypothetical protein
VFPVEIRIRENNEKVVTEKMTFMREWLDHRRFEPSAFRYRFEPPDLVFQVEFQMETEAIAFANAFAGRVTRVSAGKQAAA